MARKTDNITPGDGGSSFKAQEAEDWGDYGRQLDLDTVVRVMEMRDGEDTSMTPEDWTKWLEEDNGEFITSST